MIDRKKRKDEAITSLGGKCVKCGTEKDLQFDHKNPLTKTIEMSKALVAPYEIFIAELQKCQLLCYGCHKQKTVSEIRLKRPSSPVQRGYKPGCLCGMYSVTQQERAMKENSPKKRKSQRYVFQRWYFWSKAYIKDRIRWGD